MGPYRMSLYINRVSRGNGVTIFSTRDIITSGLTAAVLNIRLSLTLAVFVIVPLNSETPKMEVSRWNGVDI